MSPLDAVSGSVPGLGSEEFRREVRRVECELVTKFAWTAQHSGIVYRDDPASMRPMDDMTFNRVSRTGHSFVYADQNGKRKLFYYTLGDVFSALEDPETDFGFVSAERVDFLPGRPPVTKDDLGRTTLNLWKEPVWSVGEPSHAEPTPFLEHIRYLVDGDEAGAHHLLDFIAHLVQRPEERVNHAILITSEAKGIGKSSLGTIVRRLVGERNSGVAQSKDLNSSFDGWLIGKLFVQIDEIYEQGNYALANKLKPLITEPSISVNVKYGPQMVVNNFARLLMFSNHSAPLDLEPGDRRYFVVRSEAEPRDGTYYDALHAFIDSEVGMRAIYWWLVRRDISGFKPFAAPPLTEAKQGLIDASGHPIGHYIINALESGHLFHKLGAVFTMDELQRQLHDDGHGAQAGNVKEIGSALKRAGVEQGREDRGGGRVRVYKLPDWLRIQPERPF